MPSCVHYLRERYGGNCLFYTFSELAEIGQNLVGLTYSDDSPGRYSIDLVVEAVASQGVLLF